VYFFLGLWRVINATLAIFLVPDKRSWILEVVIVKRLLTWVLAIWSGEGKRRVEEGEVSLRVTRDRGGRILFATVTAGAGPGR
jgi:hypothetical protein